MKGLVQLRDRETVGLDALLHRLFAARQRLGDGFQCHALFRERVELVDLGRGPRLFMPFELVLHAMISGSAVAARISIASSRPWKATMSPVSAPIKARPSGAEKAIWPAAGSASSWPTIVTARSAPFNA